MLRSFSFLLLFCLAVFCTATRAFGAEDGPADEGHTATAESGTAPTEEHGAEPGQSDHGEGDDASHGNAHPLSADPDLAIFTAIIFCLMLVILGKFAWGPIRQALDDREHYVATQLDEAKQRNEEAQRMLKEHAQQMAGATDEVRALLDQARKDADAQKQAILDEAQKAAAAEKDRAIREIGAAKNAALQDMADASVSTAVDLAGRIVGRQLDKSDHTNLIEDAVRQFTSNN